MGTANEATGLDQASGFAIGCIQPETLTLELVFVAGALDQLQGFFALLAGNGEIQPDQAGRVGKLGRRAIERKHLEPHHANAVRIGKFQRLSRRHGALRLGKTREAVLQAILHTLNFLQAGIAAVRHAEIFQRLQHRSQAAF